MSKRIKLITLSLLMAVLLTSCSKGEVSTAFSNAFWKMVNGTNIVLDYLTPDKEPEKTNAELVLQYIQEKNTDAIYDMLCKRLKNSRIFANELKKHLILLRAMLYHIKRDMLAEVWHQLVQESSERQNTEIVVQ